MTFGIQIFEEDGTNFTETYRPFNVIDQFNATASGVRNYSVDAGEKLVIIEGNPVVSASKPSVMLSALGGVVRWPVDASSAPAPGEHRAFSYIGSPVVVLRSR